MSNRYYFILTSLPEIPDLGESPPMGLRDFRTLAADEASAAEMVDAVLLEQDLMQREAVLAGEVERVEGIVLTDAQVTGDEPLPDYLSAAPDRQYKIAIDAAWERYYRYVHDLGSARHSRFLREWTGFEVALRNALAEARASKLGLDGHDYLVAEDIASENESADDTVSAWSDAPEPLTAMKLLDRRRQEWLDENSQYFTFAVDELLAYARRLVLVNRWQTLKYQADAKEGK